MLHLLEHTLKDTISILPFLFVAFLFIELLEHKFSDKTKKIINNSGKFGPLIGSLLGIVPQCGFSVLATNLYITRVISFGTLIAIYLSTSDEMLPIMISRNVDFKVIVIFVLIKFMCGIIFGFIIDLFIRNKNFIMQYDYNICDKEECHCEYGVIKSSIKHTLGTFIVLFIITFCLNFMFEYISDNVINKMFMKNNIFGPFLGALIGLIPNCGSSIILTELFISNIINLGTCMAGLLCGSGVALLILLKSNKNIKENLFIITTLYVISVLVGIIIELIGIVLF